MATDARKTDDAALVTDETPLTVGLIRTLVKHGSGDGRGVCLKLLDIIERTNKYVRPLPAPPAEPVGQACAGFVCAGYWDLKGDTFFTDRPHGDHGPSDVKECECNCGLPYSAHAQPAAEAAEHEVHCECFRCAQQRSRQAARELAEAAGERVEAPSTGAVPQEPRERISQDYDSRSTALREWIDYARALASRVEVLTQERDETFDKYVTVVDANHDSISRAEAAEAALATAEARVRELEAQGKQEPVAEVDGQYRGDIRWLNVPPAGGTKLYAAPVPQEPPVATWRVERNRIGCAIWSLHTSGGGNANVHPNGALAADMMALLNGSDSAEFELHRVRAANVTTEPESGRG